MAECFGLGARTPVPGGLIKEHDGGVVDQLLGDRQPLALAPRQTVGARVGAHVEPQGHQDLVHLDPTNNTLHLPPTRRKLLPTLSVCKTQSRTCTTELVRVA